MLPANTPITAAPGDSQLHGDSAPEQTFWGVADAYVTPKDTPLIVDAARGVLSNDTGSTVAPLIVSQDSPPSQGTLQLGQDGAFTYTATAGFFGVDEFVYVVTQGAHTSPGIVVSITVVDNVPPTGSPDIYDTLEDVDLSVSVSDGVLANDLDADADVLEAILTQEPQHGVVDLQANGAFLYSPDQDFNGQDSWSYSARDLYFTSVEIQVVVLIQSLDDAPSGSDRTFDLRSGGRLVDTFDVVDADADPLTIRIESLPNLGTFDTFSNSLQFLYSPASVGTDLMTFTVSDGISRSADITYTFRVAPSPAPIMTRLSPTGGSTGNPLRIEGTFFGFIPGSVTIGGRPATTSQWYDEVVSVIVPTDFQPGSYSVVLTAASGLQSNALTYEVVPWISHVTPRSGKLADPVLIEGDGFGSVAGVVLISNVSANIVQWLNTRISVDVPPGLSPGENSLQITIDGGAQSNERIFWFEGPQTWVPPPRPTGGSGSGVWTGTEFIVSGNEFGRYNPGTSTWSRLSSVNAPPKLWRAKTVWTGDRVLVWGGSRIPGYSENGQGWLYDPIADAWTQTAGGGAIAGGRDSIAVLAGDEVMVMSQSGAFFYHPVDDTWRPMAAPPSNVANRHAASIVYTGTDLILWGGSVGSTYYDTGARYDMASETWTAMSDLNAPHPRRSHAAVWTRSEMVVFGGYSGSGVTVSGGGKYNPISDTWAPIGSQYSGSDPEAVWTGEEVLVIGQRYNPVTDQWTSMASGGARDVLWAASTWSGAEYLVWGGQVVNGSAPRPQVRLGRYTPTADSWTVEENVGGGLLFTVGGTVVNMVSPQPFSYDDSSGIWSRLNMLGGPDTPFRYDQAIATATHVILCGAPDSERAKYDVAAGAWSSVSSVGAPTETFRSTFIWTGTEVLVWGNYHADGRGRYDPAGDTWTTMSTVGEPSTRRSDHSAAWTGTEMIIWAGYEANSAPLGDGAAYDPMADSWRTLPTATPRHKHTAVTVGTDMYILGGMDAAGAKVAPERYNFSSQTWVPMANGGAGMVQHAAIPTDVDLVLWGGTDNTLGPWLDAGSRYDTATDTWVELPSLWAPIGEANSATWTGQDILFYGSEPVPGVYRYTP